MEHLFVVYQSLDLGANAVSLYKCRATPSTSGYIKALHQWVGEMDDMPEVVVGDTFSYLAGEWYPKRPPADLPPCVWDVDSDDWSSQYVDSRHLCLGGGNIETITFIQGSKEPEKDGADDEERQMGNDDWKAFKAARAAKRPAAAAPEGEPDAKRRRME